MRATQLIVGMACAAAFVVSAGQASANLLTNPGFESGSLTGWSALNTNAVATITVQIPVGPDRCHWPENYTLSRIR